MYRKLPRSEGRVVGYEITDKLDKEQAKQLAEELALTIAETGKVRVLFDLRAFPYGGVGAIWEDLKFDAKHLKDMERVAVVGDRALEKAAVAVFDAITPVECRYFGREDADSAWSWLEGE